MWKYVKFTLLLLCGSSVVAQAALPVEFSYDNAGNRTMRKVLPLNAKSGVAAHADTVCYKDIISTMKMRLYPNPTDGKVWVEMEGEAAWGIRVFDLGGRQLREAHGEGCRVEIDLSSYPNGELCS